MGGGGDAIGSPQCRVDKSKTRQREVCSSGRAKISMGVKGTDGANGETEKSAVWSALECLDNPLVEVYPSDQAP
jgi:hypothetical protein